MTADLEGWISVWRQHMNTLHNEAYYRSIHDALVEVEEW